MRGILSILLAALMIAPATVHAAESIVKKTATVSTVPVAGPANVSGIGVVDVVSLMRDSSAAKSIEKQLDARRKQYRDELAGQEKKLRATEDELIKERGKVKPEEFDTKRKAFEKSVRELQQNAQKKRIAFDQSAVKAAGTLRVQITQITAEVARAKKLQLVLTNEQVVIAEKTLDITAEVMAALNKKLPDVKVTIVEAPATPAKAKK